MDSGLQGFRALGHPNVAEGSVARSVFSCCVADSRVGALSPFSLSLSLQILIYDYINKHDYMCVYIYIYTHTPFRNVFCIVWCRSFLPSFVFFVSSISERWSREYEGESYGLDVSLDVSECMVWQ